METEEYISVERLCGHYEVAIEFFSNLNEMGRVRVITIKKTPCVHRDSLSEIERMIRLHRDLEVNPEGIDVILNLLDRVTQLQKELQRAKNRLHLYDDEL